MPIRAGADIAFVGGLINYVLQNDKYFHEYVVNYTNAATIITEDYQDTEDLDGMFSGFDRGGPQLRLGDLAATRARRSSRPAAPAAWNRTTGGRCERRPAARRTGRAAPTRTRRRTPIPTLQHPRCVFQILKRHFARYTPEMVAEVAGVPAAQFREVARLITENSGRDRTTAFVYSLGWTQHTVGVQYIRTAAILQALLGNMGRPGGGIMALRGHASIQGSTDIPTLFDLLPGYLPMPFAHRDRRTAWTAYVEAEKVQNGFWANTADYMVSLLKAYWGDAATADNDFCYDYLPRLTGDHSTYATVKAQIDGTCTGYFLLGQNPAVGSANARMQRMGLANLDWLVVRDLVMIESATFWKNGPEIETGEMRTEDIKTEVFFLPAAAHTEKNGSFTNTQRMLQWHHTAVEPAGDARSDLWFIYHLGRRIRAKLAGSHGRDGPAGAGPDLGLPDRGQPGRAVGRCGAGRGQRLGRGREADLVLHPAEIRRLHHLRLLDLLRGAGRRGEPGRPAQARPGAELGRPGVGLGLAGQPADPVQPGLGRPGRQAVERAQGVRLVGRGAGQVDRARRARLHRRPAAVLPAASGRHRSRRDLRHRPVHHAGRRQGLAVRPGRAGGRPAARALRTARVAAAERPLPAAAQPGARDHHRPARTGSSPAATSRDRRCSRTCSPRTG